MKTKIPMVGFDNVRDENVRPAVKLFESNISDLVVYQIWCHLV